MHARQGGYNRILLLLGNSKSPFFCPAWYMNASSTFFGDWKKK